MQPTSPKRKPALEGEPVELLEFICRREAARSESFTGQVMYVIMVLTHAAGCLRWQRRYLHDECLAKQFPFTVTEVGEDMIRYNGMLVKNPWKKITRDPSESERLQHALNHPDTPLRDVQRSGNQLCFCCHATAKRGLDDWQNMWEDVLEEKRRSRHPRDSGDDWRSKPVHKR